MLAYLKAVLLLPVLVYFCHLYRFAKRITPDFYFWDFFVAHGRYTHSARRLAKDPTFFQQHDMPEVRAVRRWRLPSFLAFDALVLLLLWHSLQ